MKKSSTPTSKEAQIYESRLQSNCFLAHWNGYPQERGRLRAINNNSYNAIQGARNKAMGVYPGASDLFYLMPNGQTLWIECKLPGETQKKGQKRFQGWCKELGHKYAVIYTEEEFWALLGLKKPDLPKSFNFNASKEDEDGSIDA